MTNVKNKGIRRTNRIYKKEYMKIYILSAKRKEKNKGTLLFLWIWKKHTVW